MSKKSVAKNYIYNLIYQILVLILPVITTPYLSRVLGAEGIGIYSYTISIVTYFILFGSLGIAMYAQREIAYVQDNKEKRSKIFWEIFILRTITLTISLIIFYFTFAMTGEYCVYYRILILEIIGNILDISAFFQGMEEFKKIIKRNLIVKAISIISIFLFVKTADDLNKYLLIYVLSTLVGNLSLWFYLPKYIKRISLKRLEIKKHLKPTIVLFIPQIASQIYVVLDKTMIGILVEDKAEVGYYEQSQKIVKIILTLATSLGTVMLPRIASEFAKGKQEQIRKSILNSFNYIFLLSIPMMIGLVVITQDLIPWFLGEGFNKSIYITYAISPIMIMIGLSSVIGTQYLLPTKKQKQYTISVITGALVNLFLNFILIPHYLSIGAAIATVVAETSVTGVQFYFIRNDFKIKEILKMSLKYFIVAILMAIILLIVNNILFYKFSVIIRMILDVTLGAIAYFGLLILLNDQFTKKLISRALKVKKGDV